MSFCYNIDKKEKKNQLLARATVCVEFARSPHVCVGFLWVLQFLPTSQSCEREANWCIYIIPV